MKAAVLTKYGSPHQAFEIKEWPDPVPKAGQVLIRVEASGLNYADVMARKGMYAPAPKPPCIIGYDVVGSIEALGEGANPNLLGKRVVAFTRFGGYAQLVATSERAVQEIADTVDAATATAMATQFSTAWQCAMEQVNLHAGNVVLVHAAAGGVGLALVQIAKQQGCTVIGTASSQHKMDLARSFGADYMVSSLAEAYHQLALSLLEGRKVDVAFNSVGGKSVKTDLKLLDFGGRVVCYGAAARKNGLIPALRFAGSFGFVHPITLLMNSKAIMGVNMLVLGDRKPEQLQRCMAGVQEWVAKGHLKPHLGKSYPAEQIGQAHEDLQNRSSMGKLAITWT